MSKYLLIKEDAATRGLRPDDLSAGLELSRDAVPALFRQFDHIWHW